MFLSVGDSVSYTSEIKPLTRSFATFGVIYHRVRDLGVSVSVVPSSLPRRLGTGTRGPGAERTIISSKKFLCLGHTLSLDLTKIP